MTVNIGFEPRNLAWDQARADLGLFYYYQGYQGNVTGVIPNSPWYVEKFHAGCKRYDDTFSEYFIDGDRTWGVSRIMAFIAAGAGLVATVSLNEPSSKLDLVVLLSIFEYMYELWNYIYDHARQLYW